MAYSNANISADEVTWAAADLPLLIGRNWLRTSGAAARWTAGTWTTDQSHADGPAAYGYDEHDHLQTYPTSLTYPDYVVNLGSAIGEIDCVVILNHNLNTVGATVAVEFDANQDGSFSAVHAAASSTPSSNKRVVFLDLDHGAVGTAQRYSEVRYMRLNITGASAVPKIGELILGRRRQLNNRSKAPFEDKKFSSRIRRSESDTAVIKDYVFFTGRRKIPFVYTLHEDDRISDVDTFFKTETDYGTLPFVWIDEPNTTPSDAYWMKFDNPELIQPALGFSEREWSLLAIEQGPNFISGGI